ncbi:MAG: NAD-dependent epimerase [bacterium]
MKILVTGTAGFIGFHVANSLINQGYEVVGLDIINDYYDINLKYDRLKSCGIDRGEIQYGKKVQSKKAKNYSFIKLDLKDKENLNALFKEEKFSKVCNLAAQAGVRYSLTNPDAYVDSNITGFLNILEASRYSKIEHLVYASSSSVYGANTKLPFSVHDNVDHPVSLYAASKKSNELMAHVYSHLFQIPTTGLRFFTVYGPWGRPDMALFIFTKAILENREFEIFNYGEMVRDFTYIDDVVSGVLKVLDKVPDSSPSKTPYKIYNIGNNSPVKLLSFVEAIEKKLGKTAKTKLVPLQPGDVPETYADVEDLVQNIGYKPETEIKTGIGKFIEWYLEYYRI